MTTATRTKKATKKTARKATAPAKKAIPAVSVKKELDLAALETALVNKYPEARIVTGSYRLAGAKDGVEKKRSVLIECAVCDATRRVATSDVFQSLTCGQPDCKKAHKKAAKEAAK